MCADSGKIIEWQVLRERYLDSIFLLAVKGIEPGAAGYEALVLCRHPN